MCGFADCGPYASLTLFDLVVPDALPLLHQIFLTSLYEEFPGHVNEEMNLSPSGYNIIEPSTSDDGSVKSSTKNSSYLSLTVTCVEFLKGQCTYFITVSSRLCHCIVFVSRPFIHMCLSSQLCA